MFAFLSGELINHYRNRQVLSEAQQSFENLRTLNDEYDELLAKIESNPELLERLGPAILGAEPNDPNTVNPHFTPQQLEAAKLILREPNEQQDNELPRWLLRANEPHRRLAIILASSFLIMISFIWFAAAKTKP